MGYRYKVVPSVTHIIRYIMYTGILFFDIFTVKCTQKLARHWGSSSQWLILQPSGDGMTIHSKYPS